VWYPQRAFNGVAGFLHEGNVTITSCRFNAEIVYFSIEQTGMVSPISPLPRRDDLSFSHFTVATVHIRRNVGKNRTPPGNVRPGLRENAADALISPAPDDTSMICKMQTRCTPCILVCSGSPSQRLFHFERSHRFVSELFSHQDVVLHQV